MLNAKQLAEAGFSVNDTPEDLLRVEAGFEYLEQMTVLTFDVDDVETIKKLPAAAKLFITKFADIVARQHGITAESLGGMSQSFGYTDYLDELRDLLYGLLRPWLKENIDGYGAKAIQFKDRWDYRRC